MRNELITLITKKAAGAQVGENSIEVFAEKKSVTRSEFYAAYSAGLNPKFMFNIDSMDYEAAEEPQMVLYNNKRYNIIRAYETPENGVELTVG